MKNLIRVQELINDFAKIERSHYVAKTKKRENNVHHSYSVTLLAWMLNDMFEFGLDMDKVLRYALVHDITETYVGDVSSYANQEQRLAKIEAEAKALDQIEREFGAIFPGLAETIRKYESKEDDEAAFVWSVDKIQALMHDKQDNFRAFYEQGLTRQMIEKREAEKLAGIYKPLQSYYSQLLKDFLADYDGTKVDPHGSVRVLNPASRK